MNDAPLLTLSKIDAATRQLNQAILLFFDGGDPVSVHTLTEAAGQILRDIGKPKNVVGLARRPSAPIPVPKPEWFTALAAARNFFKHADKDPLATLTFNPALNETSILDAISVYERLTESRTDEMDIYVRWYVIKHPSDFAATSKTRAEADRAIAEGIDPRNLAFFKSAIQFAKKIHLP